LSLPPCNVEVAVDFPPQSPGYTFNCKEGTFADNCNGCIPLNTTLEQYFDAILFGDCCDVGPAGGKADNSLNFVLDEVFPLVNEALLEATSGVSKLTDDRDGTMIFGYSLGGLMTCYALWTRPEVLRIQSMEQKVNF
jgi:hypothetical protein